MHRPRRASSPDNALVAPPAAASSIMRRPGRSSVLVSSAAVNAAWAGLDADRTGANDSHTRSDSQSGSDPHLDHQHMLILLEARLAKIEELNEQIRHSDSRKAIAEKHAQALQTQLDDASKDQGMMEERIQEQDEQLDEIRNEKKALFRQCREYETIYEGEQMSMLREKEQTKEREEQLMAIIEQLKASLSHKDRSRLRSTSAHTDSPDSSHLGSPASLVHGSGSRTSSAGNSKLLLQKDKVIESLRLELAESQHKLVEIQNMGGGRLQLVEKELHDARLANGRLVEDNESYQLLLSERTLNGDFSHGDLLRPKIGSLLHIPGPSSVGGESHDGGIHRPLSSVGDAREDGIHLSTLADELEEVESDRDGEMDEGVDDGGADAASIHELESQINTLNDTNRALTLYINEILERILNHKSYEEILIKPSNGDNNSGLGNDAGDDGSNSSNSTPDGAPASRESSLTDSPTSIRPNTHPIGSTTNGLHSTLTSNPMGPSRLLDFNKALPQPPQSPAPAVIKPARPQSIIEKTKAIVFPSLVSSPVKPRRPRPMSIHEDPATAPSIPLSRSMSTRLPSSSSAASGDHLHHHHHLQHQQRHNHQQPKSGAGGAGSLEGILANRATSTGPNPAFSSPRNSIFSTAGTAAGSLPGGAAKRLSITGRNLSWNGNPLTMETGVGGGGGNNGGSGNWGAGLGDNGSIAEINDISSFITGIGPSGPNLGEGNSSALGPGGGGGSNSNPSIDGTSSPPRSISDTTSESYYRNTMGGGAPSIASVASSATATTSTTMSGNIRPLRLVESANTSSSSRAGNRSSWISTWLGY